MSNTKRISTIICLDCEEKLDVPEKTQIGEYITCLFCEAQMRIISVNPIRVDWGVDDEVLDEYANGLDLWDEDDGWFDI